MPSSLLDSEFAWLLVGWLEWCYTLSLVRVTSFEYECSQGGDIVISCKLIARKKLKNLSYSFLETIWKSGNLVKCGKSVSFGQLWSVITSSSGWARCSSSYRWKVCGMIFPTPPSLLDSEFAWFLVGVLKWCYTLSFLRVTSFENERSQGWDIVISWKLIVRNKLKNLNY